MSHRTDSRDLELVDHVPLDIDGLDPDLLCGQALIEEVTRDDDPLGGGGPQNAPQVGPAATTHDVGDAVDGRALVVMVVPGKDKLHSARAERLVRLEVDRVWRPVSAMQKVIETRVVSLEKLHAVTVARHDVLSVAPHLLTFDGARNGRSVRPTGTDSMDITTHEVVPDRRTPARTVCVLKPR